MELIKNNRKDILEALCDEYDISIDTSEDITSDLIKENYSTLLVKTYGINEDLRQIKDDFFEFVDKIFNQIDQLEQDEDKDDENIFIILAHDGLKKVRITYLN